MYPKYSADLYDSYIHATAKPHWCLVLDLSQDFEDQLRFRIEIFPDGGTVSLIYTPVGYQTHRSTYHGLHVPKVSDPKLRKAIIAKCKQEILKSICECALNVLRGNIPLFEADAS